MNQEMEEMSGRKEDWHFERTCYQMNIMPCIIDNYN